MVTTALFPPAPPPGALLKVCVETLYPPWKYLTSIKPHRDWLPAATSPNKTVLQTPYMLP